MYIASLSKDNRYTLREGNSVVNVLPSEQMPTLEEMNLLSLEAKSFLVEQTPFQKGLGICKSKQEVTEVPPS